MNSDLQRRFIVFGMVLVVALLFLAPTIVPNIVPQNWISKKIQLGLDLSGGVHLAYEVQTEEAVKNRLQGIANSIRSDLKKQKIAVTRARGLDNNELEIVLLTERFTAQAKSLIEDQYRHLSFVETRQDGGRPALVYSIPQPEAERIKAHSVTQAVETLRTRVDQFGVAEPLIQTAGRNRVILQMPGVTDIESVKRVVGSVAQLEFRLLPVRGSKSARVTLKDRDGTPVEVEEDVLMTGEAVDTARAVMPEGQIEVSLSLTSDGAKIFRKITGENVGRNLAIILDGTVYSSPTINEAIPGGQARISGGFTSQEARELAVVLRSGALPAPLKVMEERTVGPTLGQESIMAGVYAILGGFVFIIVFSILYYGKSGMVAVASLVLNMVLILAALSAFGATLTLPGLAGLALTIGMAVDSNILIFERIRDELRNGSTRDAAVELGFKHALTAIIDANLTTLLTGIILYYFGTGPIRGFAVTLSIGVLTTLYCATFASRLAFDTLPLRGRKGLSV